MTFEGATSGKVTLTPASAAGTPTLTFPTTSGTFALTSQLPVQTKTMVIENPSTSENKRIMYTDVAITITKVADAVLGTSPSVTYQINFASTRDSGSPTALFSSDRTVTSTSGTTTTTFNDATIPAGSYIWVTTSANGGTVTDFETTIIYTQD